MTLPLFNDFKNLLVKNESRGSYRSNNGIAFGLYQFTKKRIRTVATYLNEAIPSIEWFLNDRNMQDRYFLAHIELILAYIEKNDLTKYVGKVVTGKNKYKKSAEVNLYGIVAGAHLGGEAGVKYYLRDNVDRKDSLGTYISDYVAKFSDLMNEKVTVKKKSSNIFAGIGIGLISFIAIKHL